jgi:hypothetical protein
VSKAEIGNFFGNGLCEYNLSKKRPRVQLNSRLNRHSAESARFSFNRNRAIGIAHTAWYRNVRFLPDKFTNLFFNAKEYYLLPIYSVSIFFRSKEKGYRAGGLGLWLSAFSGI